MAPFSRHHLLIYSLLFTLTSAAPSFRPKALVIPVSKDPSTLQYKIKLTQRTPPISVPLTIHLGGPFLWVDCDKNYHSSTYRPARCNSAQCSLANSKACGTCNAPPRPGCNNNTCGLFPENPFTNTATGGELASDIIRVASTDGSNPGRVVSVPNFLFSCAPTFLLQGLARGVQGIAGLGKTKISLSPQFSSAFSFVRKFAICLPSSSSSNGVVFFGDGPYKFFYETDVSSLLNFTPLMTNPVSDAGETSSEYYIGVTGIKINGKEVSINKALLVIDKQGNGGTKLSTVIPYTIMQTSIYKAVKKLFEEELKISNVTRVKAVAPFEVCCDKRTFPASRFGDGVPWINLVLQDGNTSWTLIGGNLMVPAMKDDENVVCLGLMDGGEKPKTAIVVGGFQLHDNLLQFDLARSRLGFSNPLLLSRTSCSNFNFTSTL